MSRWSARFREDGQERCAQPSAVSSLSSPPTDDGSIPAYAPFDTVDTVDTVCGVAAGSLHCVNSVHSVKGGIAEERGGSAPPAPIVSPSDADAAVLAEALMAEAERNSAVTITDRAQARLYWQGEARRRLNLIRQRAAAAVTGPDIERAAIQAEDHAPMASSEDQAEAVAGLLRAAAVHRLHGRAEHPTNPDLEQHVEPA